MSDSITQSLILHHYSMSPFSEKIRAVLGYTGLPWHSVQVPEMPPRRALKPLAGDYRKIPVAQLGADVFCDSRIISSEIATLSGRPTLALENVSAAEQAFVRHTDLEVFFACILSADGKVLLKKLWRDTSTLHVLRFLADRINMGRKSAVPAARGARAKTMVRDHLDNLQTLLQQDFLFGEQPSIADFSAWHSAWFMADLAQSTFIKRYPAVDEWMARMRAFGHGTPQPMTPEEAIAVARAASPRPLPESEAHPLLNQQVQIAPTDYGQVPVTGVLKAITAERYILAREHARTGLLHVHFPRADFSLQAANAK